MVVYALLVFHCCDKEVPQQPSHYDYIYGLYKTAESAKETAIASGYKDPTKEISDGPAAYYHIKEMEVR